MQEHLSFYGGSDGIRSAGVLIVNAGNSVGSWKPEWSPVLESGTDISPGCPFLLSSPLVHPLTQRPSFSLIFSLGERQRTAIISWCLCLTHTFRDPPWFLLLPHPLQKKISYMNPEVLSLKCLPNVSVPSSTPIAAAKTPPPPPHHCLLVLAQKTESKSSPRFLTPCGPLNLHLKTVIK